MGPARPAASAALQDRLLLLVCDDILEVCAGQLSPKVGLRGAFRGDANALCCFEQAMPAAAVLQKGKLPYLASWAASLAAIGLRLPEQQLGALCSYLRQHGRQLKEGDRMDLQRAFEAWGHQPGLALLARLGEGK